jgi:peptidoglycan hydrolase-like protein with peptidoglycan-binding domain
VPTPEQAERDLGLSRSVRRQVQADLTVLGFDTRGVDGIFGGGTRSALRAWQGGNDVEVTGFLTAEQLARLNAQADIRREEIRVEDERRAREQRQADEAFWRQTGASGAEEDLRTYLNRYPEGAYAQQARAILSDIDRQREGAADDAAWADASAADTERAYLRYMRRYPEGLHAGEARARIDELRRGTANLDEVEVHRDQERALGLNVASALVIEQRLRALGYQVGPVDGQLDNTTRDAIARFQGEQGLTATGYLNTATVQRLILASSR